MPNRSRHDESFAYVTLASGDCTRPLKLTIKDSMGPNPWSGGRLRSGVAGPIALGSRAALGGAR